MLLYFTSRAVETPTPIRKHTKKFCTEQLFTALEISRRNVVWSARSDIAAKENGRRYLCCKCIMDDGSNELLRTGCLDECPSCVAITKIYSQPFVRVDLLGLQPRHASLIHDTHETSAYDLCRISHSCSAFNATMSQRDSNLHVFQM